VDPNIVRRTREKYLVYEQRHQDILNSAIRLFNSKGFKGATIAEIAHNAGITEPIIYNHFKNKKDLFIECFHSIENQLQRQNLQLYRNTKGDEISYLKGAAKEYFQFLRENPDKSMFLIHLRTYKNDPEFDGIFRESMERYFGVFEKILSLAKKKGRIKSKINDHVLARIFVVHMLALVFLGDFVDPEYLTEEMISLYLSDMLGIS
jgi:AcrR family transcriptional regulator